VSAKTLRLSSSLVSFFSAQTNLRLITFGTAVLAATKRQYHLIAFPLSATLSGVF